MGQLGIQSGGGRHLHVATCGFGGANGIQLVRAHARKQRLVCPRCVTHGRLWYCLILMADSDMANGKLIISLCAQASECPSLMFLDQRFDAHQAQKWVEVAINSFDLLNAMHAAVHLLVLAATVTDRALGRSQRCDWHAQCQCGSCLPLHPTEGKQPCIFLCGA